MNTCRRVVGLAMLFLVACGSTGSGISSSAATRLQAEVNAIKSAANGANRSAAAHQLAQLLATIDQLRARDQLSQAAAARIRHAAEAVNSRLALLPLPTTTTTAPPPEDDNRKNHKPGHGNGQGNPHNESD